MLRRERVKHMFSCGEGITKDSITRLRGLKDDDTIKKALDTSNPNHGPRPGEDESAFLPNIRKDSRNRRNVSLQ